MQDLFYRIIKEIDVQDMAVGAIIMVGILLIIIISAATEDDWN
jgi:hypothetical protein